MSLAEMWMPESPQIRFLYFIIITINAVLSFKLPASFQGLVITCLIYGLLLTGKLTGKMLALVISIFRLLSLVPLQGDIPAWSMFIVYSAAFIICWVIYKMTTSIDNSQLLDIFDVELIEPPKVYLKLLDYDSAYFGWEHKTKFYIDSFDIEINNIIVGKAKRFEKKIGITNLRPNIQYRVRVWATSSTNGRAPSLYLTFKTPDKPIVELQETSVTENTYLTLDDQIKQLNLDIKNAEASLEAIDIETARLQKLEASLLNSEQVDELSNEATELRVKINKRQEEVATLRANRNKAINGKNAVERSMEALEVTYNRLNSDLKTRQKEIEAATKQNEVLPSEHVKEIEDYKLRIQAKKQELIEELRKRSELEGELSTQNKKLDELNETLGKFKQELHNVQDVHAAVLLKKSELGDINLNQLAKYCELQSKFDEMDNKKRYLMRQLSEINTQKINLLQALAQLNNRRSNHQVSDAENESTDTSSDTYAANHPEVAEVPEPFASSEPDGLPFIPIVDYRDKSIDPKTEEYTQQSSNLFHRTDSNPNDHLSSFPQSFAISNSISAPSMTWSGLKSTTPALPAKLLQLNEDLTNKSSSNTTFGLPDLPIWNSDDSKFSHHGTETYKTPSKSEWELSMELKNRTMLNNSSGTTKHSPTHPNSTNFNFSSTFSPFHEPKDKVSSFNTSFAPSHKFPSPPTSTTPALSALNERFNHFSPPHNPFTSNILNTSSDWLANFSSPPTTTGGNLMPNPVDRFTFNPSTTPFTPSTPSSFPSNQLDRFTGFNSTSTNLPKFNTPTTPSLAGNSLGMSRLTSQPITTTTISSSHPAHFPPGLNINNRPTTATTPSRPPGLPIPSTLLNSTSTPAPLRYQPFVNPNFGLSEDSTLKHTMTPNPPNPKSRPNSNKSSKE